VPCDAVATAMDRVPVRRPDALSDDVALVFQHVSRGDCARPHVTDELRANATDRSAPCCTTTASMRTTTHTPMCAMAALSRDSPSRSRADDHHAAHPTWLAGFLREYYVRYQLSQRPITAFGQVRLNARVAGRFGRDAQSIANSVSRRLVQGLALGAAGDRPLKAPATESQREAMHPGRAKLLKGRPEHEGSQLD